MHEEQTVHFDIQRKYKTVKMMITVALPIAEAILEESNAKGVTFHERLRDILGEWYLSKNRKPDIAPEPQSFKGTMWP